MTRRRTHQAAPPLPPKTPEEIAADREMLAEMQALTVELQQRNLANAVLLAQMAAQGRGPLVDHFAELGRRYGDLLQAPQPKPRPALRVVEGGE